jgi:hypothetical protein
MPLTTHDVSLMLRSGYSSDAVIRELSTRHFADTFDSGTEQQLTKAGASQALLDALRTGSFRASTQEIAAAEQKRATQEELTQAARERSAATQNDDSHGQADSRPKSPSAGNRVNQVYQLVKGDLVRYRQGSISHFDDEQLEQKKYFLFFFSANWSQAGRKLTPMLIQYYNRVTAQHPEVEVIFFSADRSQFGMETYLSQSNMPWPAVDFPKIANKAAAMDTKLINDIPALLLVSATGQIVSQTGSGDKPKTAEQVLADLDAILAGGQPKQVATSR